MKYCISLLLFFCFSAFGKPLETTHCDIQHENVEFYKNIQYRTTVITDSATLPRIRRSRVKLISTDEYVEERYIEPGFIPLIETNMNPVGENAYEFAWTLEISSMERSHGPISMSDLNFLITVTCD